MNDSSTEYLIYMTFKEDLDGLKTAPLRIQIEVGKKVLEDIKLLSQLTVSNLNKVVPQLREKFKKLRHQAINNGAENELDPNYAYAAVMESVILAIERDEISEKVLGEIMLWLNSINLSQN
jgi:hypothetical protein